MKAIRILVVEDFEPFRRLVRRHLERRPEFQIIGEVADGLEAVQKAKELQPDLVLIDIGLPTLNGIEAARRIREVAPPPNFCSSAWSLLPASYGRPSDLAHSATLRSSA